MWLRLCFLLQENSPWCGGGGESIQSALLACGGGPPDCWAKRGAWVDSLGRVAEGWVRGQTLFPRAGGLAGGSYRAGSKKRGVAARSVRTEQPPSKFRLFVDRKHGGPGEIWLVDPARPQGQSD